LRESAGLSKSRRGKQRDDQDLFDRIRSALRCTSSGIKFDLETPQIDTLIHELCHASSDVCASETAPRGTPARAHWDVVNSIWADLYTDPRHQVMGLARYPRMKADEIVA